jgi:hypothetical protein
MVTSSTAPSPVPRWAVVLAAVLAIALAAHALAKPKYGWDLMTYVGCAFQALGSGDWTESHRRTFEYLPTVLPAPVFEHMTTSPPGIGSYRSIVTSDPEAWRQRLGAACYKIGYVAPVVGLSALGVDPYLSTRIMAAIPAAAFLFVAALWMSGRIPPAVALPLAVIAAFAGLFQTARYEYPDGMTALAIGGALLCFASDRTRWACILFLAAIVVRADAILYFGMFLGFAVFLADRPRRLRFLEAVPWGLAALALWGAINWGFDMPSFVQAFHHSFIANQPYLTGAAVTLTPADYLEVMARQVDMVANKSAKYPVLIGLALAAAALSWRHPAARPAGELALVSLLLVVFHFLFIPWFDTRYYAAPYFLIVAGFGMVLWHRARAFREHG